MHKCAGINFDLLRDTILGALNLREMQEHAGSISSSYVHLMNTQVLEQAKGFNASQKTDQVNIKKDLMAR